MKMCIINFADGVFQNGQDRLQRSLAKFNYDYETLFFKKLPNGCPEHKKVPWGFKVYAFEEARKRNKDMALWIDSAGIVVRSLDKIKKILEEKGVFVFSRYNSSVGEWSSDYFLEKNKLKREDVLKIPEISAFCIGINFKHKNGQDFFIKWKAMADDGVSFLGLPEPYTVEDSLTNFNRLVSKSNFVYGHRHDQTCASVIANQLGILPVNNYIFDLIGEANNGNKYAKYIPINTLILQDRDIKTGDFIRSVDKDWNKTGFKKVLYFVCVAFYSFQRKIKDLIKWYFRYKFKYKI